MNQRVLTMATAGTLVILGMIGFIDAVRSDRTGPAVLFALMSLGVLALSKAAAKPGTITLRRDLASWLERTSPVTGESPDAMANRAVSRLRAGFGSGDRADEP